MRIRSVIRVNLHKKSAKIFILSTAIALVSILTLGATPALAGETTNQFTISLYVNPQTSIASKALLGKAEEVRLFTDASGLPSCQIKNTTWQTAAAGTATLSLNAWSHVSCTYDKAVLRLYVNGIQVGTSNLTVALDDTANNFLVGEDDSADAVYTNFTGTVDQFQVYNYARTAKQINADMTGGAGSAQIRSVSANNPVAYWKFDQGVDNTCSGGTNDVCNSGSAGSTLDGANSGFASPATSTSGWTQSGKFGKALIFDGSNDLISVSNNTSLNTTGDITLSAWIRQTSTNGTGVDAIISKLATGNNDKPYALYNSLGTPILLLGNGGSYTAATATGANVADGNWHHIVGTVNGTALTVYIDGVSKATATFTGTRQSNTNALQIGKYNTAGNFTGSIDEVKIYNYALTADEVKLDYNRGSSLVLGSLSDNSSYQPQAANQEYCIPGDSTSCAAPVGRWDFEGKTGQTVYDISGNGFSATLGANSSTGSDDPTWAIGKYGGGLNFDGSDDTVTYATSGSSALDISNASVSLSAWVNISPQETGGDIAGKCFASIYGYGIKLVTNNTLQVSIRNSTTNASYLSDTAITTNQWNFVAATIEDTGSSTTIRFYINGQLVKTTTGAIRIGNNSTNPIQIGGDCWRATPAAANTLLGRIDAVRIYNYVRTPAQVAWDYNRGAPVGHWKFDECQGNTVNDGSGMMNNGTITIGASGTQTSVGTCTGSANTAWKDGATGKINYSLDFDGTDDYVTMGDINSLDGITQLTLSAWVKPSSLAELDAIIGKFSVTANTGWVIETGISGYGGSDDIIIGVTNDGSDFAHTNTNVLSVGIWAHIVMVYDGSQGTNSNRLKLYVNGTEQVLTHVGTTLTSTPSTTHAFRVGATTDDQRFFPGQIDDARIYNYALTAAQVKLLYNNGAVNFAPSTGAP